MYTEYSNTLENQLYSYSGRLEPMPREGGARKIKGNGSYFFNGRLHDEDFTSLGPPLPRNLWLVLLGILHSSLFPRQTINFPTTYEGLGV